MREPQESPFSKSRRRLLLDSDLWSALVGFVRGKLIPDRCLRATSTRSCDITYRSTVNKMGGKNETIHTHKERARIHKASQSSSAKAMNRRNLILDRHSYSKHLYSKQLYEYGP